jgi:transcriptional regulator with XRE-family HTH domain
MIDVSKETKISNFQRLETIGKMLKEIRFSEGMNQDEFTEYGATRRQIQRGEHGLNLTLTSLFNLLDCYGYTLRDFFEDME